MHTYTYFYNDPDMFIAAIDNGGSGFFVLFANRLELNGSLLFPEASARMRIIRIFIAHITITHHVRTRSSKCCPLYPQCLLILHHKNLNQGDYLIDDRTKNGAGEFAGELILFGSDAFPDWNSVVEYLCRN